MVMRLKKCIDGIEYEFVEECLLEDRANLINDKLGEDGNLTKVVKTELGWAVYSRPKKKVSWSRRYLFRGKGK